MKRSKFIKYLNKNNCFIKREGSKHSIFYNSENNKYSTLPRQKELKNELVNKICKDLGIKQIN